MKRAKSGWDGVVLVCGKCSKKVGGGFGDKGRTPLAKALRKIVGKGRRASVGVVEVKCLKLCPKGAVTVVDGRNPARWLAVPPGEPITAVLDALNLEAKM